MVVGQFGRGNLSHMTEDPVAGGCHGGWDWAARVLAVVHRGVVVPMVVGVDIAELDVVLDRVRPESADMLVEGLVVLVAVVVGHLVFVEIAHLDT